MSVKKLPLQSESSQLYSRCIWLFSQAKQDREVIFALLDELDRVRKEWQNSFDKCLQLETLVKIERKGRMALQEENENLKQELSLKLEKDSPRGRKRSIDFLTDDPDTPVLPRKVRRSSSVPTQSLITNSCPANRGLARTLTSSEEEAKPKRRSLDSDDLGLRVSREHNFESKRNFLSGIICDHCKGSIRYCFMFLRCKACKLSYHESCTRKLESMPCLPRLITPKRDKGQTKTLRLADFAPESKPMIPHLVVHCVMHLEKTLSDCKLYETFGDDKIASKLLSDFMTQRNVPDLTKYDSSTIAGTLMMFLMHIREPLVLYSSRKEFFSAENEDDLIDAIHSLPIPHRDTLAYLANHWKRLGECNMSKNLTVHSLANSLGPIVFGTLRPGSSSFDNNKMNDNSKAILQKIMELPYEGFKLIICQDDDSSTYTNSTPLSRTGSDSRKNKPLPVKAL